MFRVATNAADNLDAARRGSELPRRRTLASRFGRLLAIGLASASAPAAALRPTDPPVRELIDAGAAALAELKPDHRLGGECVAALALYKAGLTDAPRVEATIQACLDQASDVQTMDEAYSHGLAMMLLAEVAPKRHRSTLRLYLEALERRQKDHGGWGYNRLPTGDTSQTQYAALALWQCHRVGVRAPASSAKQMIDWLWRTQDPTGAWGYQGRPAPSGDSLVKQDRQTRTLAAAAMASLMIGADLHGVLPGGGSAAAASETSDGPGLPDGVRLVGASVVARPLPAAGVPWRQVERAFAAGDAWLDKTAKEAPGAWPNYYLYALERYHAFREARTGRVEPEPEWYERGFEYLKANQKRPGVWDAQCGEVADTGFAILFLLRATQRSIQDGIGEGALVSGRGLPKNLARARLRRGQVIAEADPVGVGDFLSLLDRDEADRLDALYADPTALLTADLGEADLERLAQVMRNGPPDARKLAATALGRSGRLDAAPALIFGLTDPDPVVTRAARDALRRLSRRPEGFGLPNRYDDDARYLAVEKWKRWYLALEPNAVIDLGR